MQLMGLVSRLRIYFGLRPRSLISFFWLVLHGIAATTTNHNCELFLLAVSPAAAGHLCFLLLLLLLYDNYCCYCTKIMTKLLTLYHSLELSSIRFGVGLLDFKISHYSDYLQRLPGMPTPRDYRETPWSAQPHRLPRHSLECPTPQTTVRLPGNVQPHQAAQIRD